MAAQDGVGIITLGAGWLFDVSAVEALADAATEFAADEDVRTVLIEGPGLGARHARGHDAHGDEDRGDGEPPHARDPRQAAERDLAATDALRRVELLARPVACALDVSTDAGGFEIALACHLRVVAPDVRLALVSPARGCAPRWGSAARLARCLGESRALAHLLLAPDGMAASEAVDAGLALPAPAPGAARGEALRLLRRIGALDATHVSACLEVVRHGADLAVEDALFLEATLAGLAGARRRAAVAGGDA